MTNGNIVLGHVKVWRLAILSLLVVVGVVACGVYDDDNFDASTNYQNLALEYDEFDWIPSDRVTPQNIVAKFRERSDKWVTTPSIAPTMETGTVATKYMGVANGVGYQPYLYIYRSGNDDVNISHFVTALTFLSDYEVEIIVINDYGYGFYEDIDRNIYIQSGFNSFNLKTMFPNQSNWDKLGASFNVFVYVKELSDVSTDAYIFNPYNIYEVLIETHVTP